MADDSADDGGVRCWLVERTYTDKGLVSLVYATADGERVLRRERSPEILQRTGGVTAATTVDPDGLEPVADADDRERYATEAARMADRHDPDETV
ncbi:MAG: hypothetical protein ABEJ61_03275 [Haloferacaceae archaeon]